MASDEALLLGDCVVLQRFEFVLGLHYVTYQYQLLPNPNGGLDASHKNGYCVCVALQLLVPKRNIK
jgi:hypothetical protein